MTAERGGLAQSVEQRNHNPPVAGSIPAPATTCKKRQPFPAGFFLRSIRRKGGKSAMRARAMTAGSPWKHILSFMLPILAGALLQQLYHTADTVIVGNFSGQHALAAVGTTNTFAFFFLAVAIGFSAGNGVLVAQHFGAGRKLAVRRDAAAGILFLLALGGIASLAGILFARPAFRIFVGVPPEILDDTVLYFQIYAAGLIFQYGYNILAAVLRSVGDSAATLYFLLVASVLNIVLDLLFVAVFRRGVAGVAVATDIAQACSMAAAWIYMVRRYPVFRFRLRALRWHREIVRETFRIGLPIALQLVIVSLGLTLIQRAVNGFGAVMTASFTVGQRMELYLHLPCHSLQTTLATFTGQNVGAGRLDRVKRGARQGVLISIAFTALISLLVWCFPRQIIDFFALNEEAAAYCQAHLRAAAFINIVLAAYLPLFGVFQGTGHTVIPTVVALAALTLRVSITYLVKDTAFFGCSIIWWNGLFGFCLGAAIAWGCYWHGFWQKNNLSSRLRA